VKLGTRDLRVPLFWYLAVTLVLPAVRGAWNEPDFWSHAATVSAVAAILVSLRVIWAAFPPSASSR
jgi:hypothetical protein